MVMDRLGSDLQKVCERNGGKLKKHTVLQLGRVLVSPFLCSNQIVFVTCAEYSEMLTYKPTMKF